MAEESVNKAMASIYWLKYGSMGADFAPNKNGTKIWPKGPKATADIITKTEVPAKILLNIFSERVGLLD